MRDRHLSGSKKDKLRFAIGDECKLYSEVWTLWCRRSDVYLTSKAFGGRIKLSLHQSGVCQYAFSKDFYDASAEVLEPGFPDRTWERWHRKIAVGKVVVHAATVVLSSCEDWEEYDVHDNADIKLLPSPPHGYCFEVCLIFSGLSHASYAEAGAAVLMREFALENGEFLSVWAVFTKLPLDYFDFQKVSGSIVEFGPVLAGKGDDVRGISIMHLSRKEDGPLEIHSRHNMRLVRVERGSPMPVYRRKLPWWDVVGRIRRYFPQKAG